MATGSSGQTEGDWRIDADFPGGNILVDCIDGDRIELQPDLRDTTGDWFYWCFRVRGAAGRTLTFHFTRQKPIGVRGPAISLDEGRTWQWLGRDGTEDDRFTHAFTHDVDDVRFGMGMTYTQTHLDAFLKRMSPSSVRREVLCASRGGRAVERLRLGERDAPTIRRVLITARHHACEMMSSYAVEGIVAAAAASDAVGRWFRNNVDLRIIPFVDQDGVERGDQGKNRRPRDHNRDYDGISVHPETAAIRQWVPQWIGDAPLILLDLHGPWLRGGINEIIYQVGQADSRRQACQERFGQILASVRRGSLPYDPANDLLFGQGWNHGANYRQGLSCTAWGASLPQIDLVSTLELPYANADGVEVNASSARAFGDDLARALKGYIESAE